MATKAPLDTQDTPWYVIVAIARKSGWRLVCWGGGGRGGNLSVNKEKITFYLFGLDDRIQTIEKSIANFVFLFEKKTKKKNIAIFRWLWQPNWEEQKWVWFECEHALRAAHRLIPGECRLRREWEDDGSAHSKMELANYWRKLCP